MAELLRNWNKEDNEKTTVIIASVSAGNVGQLAVDAFIHTLNADYFDNVNALDCVLPLFGPNPFSVDNQQPSVTGFTSYYSAADHLLLFQQRSDFVAWKKKEFLTRLIDWFRKQRFRSIVVLCGCFAYARTDEELRGPTTTRYLCTTEAEVLFAKSLLPEFRLQKRSENDDEQNRPYHLPGGGIAEALYYKCVEEKLPLSIFLNYVNEGDNYKDALDLAKFCDDLLHLRQHSKVREPKALSSNGTIDVSLKFCTLLTERFQGPPSWIKNNELSDDAYS